MYCDYIYYRNEYYGNLIAEADFPRLATRASDFIDRITYDRLQNKEWPERTMVKVKKAVCALADKMSEIETANDVIRQNVGIASVSSGSESISYRSGNEISQAEQEKSFSVLVCGYLSGTGLLYAGL